MAKDFDPYYKWLGIPPKDQPPNHYRLLGIEVFESDRDVIDAAANRVMSYLKDMATSDEVEYSQQLLNEVSRARICLLNKQQKTAYDSELRTSLGDSLDTDDRKPAVRRPKPGNGQAVAPAAPPPKPPVGPPIAEPAAPLPTINTAGPGKTAPIPTIVAEPSGVVKQRPGTPKPIAGKGPNTMLIGLGILAAVAVLGILLLLMLLFGGDGTEVASIDPEPIVPHTVGSNGTSAGDSDAEPETLPIPGLDLEPSPEVAPLPNVDHISGNGGPSDDTVDPTTTPPADPRHDPFKDPPVPVTVPSEDQPGDFALPTDIGLDPTETPTDSGTGADTAGQGSMEPDNSQDDSSTPRDTDNSAPEAAAVPFAALPAAVSLPDLAAHGAGQPVPLAAIQLVPNELCFIKLRGGENACKGNPSFAMRNANGGLAERDWDITLQESDSSAAITIAKLSIANDNLIFQWQPDAAANPLAAQLCNCVLSLSHAGQSGVVRLREPTVVPPFEVDLKKSESSQDWKIAFPPDPSAVLVAFTGDDGMTFTVNPPTPIGTKKDQAKIKIEDGGDLLNLTITSDLKRTFELTSQPHVEEATDIAPFRFIYTQLGQQQMAIANRIQQMQLDIRQRRRTLGQLPSAQQKIVDQQLTIIKEQQIPAANAVLKRYQDLDQWLQANQGVLQIGFRLYYNADTTEVDLLRSAPTDAP